MSKGPRILGIAAIAVVIVLLGVAVGWLGSRGASSGTPGSSPLPLAQSTPGAANTTPTAPPQIHSPPRIRRHPPRSPTTSTNGELAAATNAPGSATATNALPEWEDKIDEILASDDDDPQKAKKMLELFPKLPEDGQVEVAQHLSNLIGDEDYPALAALLRDAKLPEAVLDVLMADALNRPNGAKLPLLLDVAKDPQNPKAEEAKEVLELFLEEDYGNDWARWQARMDDWLKQNPD